MWTWKQWGTALQNVVLNLRDSVAAWGVREVEVERAERSDRQRIATLEGLLEDTRIQFFQLKGKVETIMTTVAEVKAEYETLRKVFTDKLAADGDKLTALQSQIDALKASGVDAAELQSLKDEMDADLAAAQSATPAPAPSSEPAPAPSDGSAPAAG